MDLAFTGEKNGLNHGLGKAEGRAVGFEHDAQCYFDDAQINSDASSTHTWDLGWWKMVSVGSCLDNRMVTHSWLFQYSKGSHKGCELLQLKEETTSTRMDKNNII